MILCGYFLRYRLPGVKTSCVMATAIALLPFANPWLADRSAATAGL